MLFESTIWPRLADGSVTVAYRSADVGTVEAEPQRAPDKENLTEAHDDDQADPMDTMIELLGGEVVQDTGRE